MVMSHSWSICRIYQGLRHVSRQIVTLWPRCCRRETTTLSSLKVITVYRQARMGSVIASLPRLPPSLRIDWADVIWQKHWIKSKELLLSYRLLSGGVSAR